MLGKMSVRKGKSLFLNIFSSLHFIWINIYTHLNVYNENLLDKINILIVLKSWANRTFFAFHNTFYPQKSTSHVEIREKFTHTFLNALLTHTDHSKALRIIQKATDQIKASPENKQTPTYTRRIKMLVEMRRDVLIRFYLNISCFLLIWVWTPRLIV